MLSLVHVGHNYWHPIIATSFSQGNSSEFSAIMPEEFGEHLIRDQRPFSSYRISPDPSDSQLHVSTSSLQFTHSFSVGFRSEDRDSHGKRFILCSVTHFCVYFDVCFGLLSWWKIQTRPIIRFLTEAVRFWFFICWYLIESMMPCIWTRCSAPLAEKQAQGSRFKVQGSCLFVTYTIIQGIISSEMEVRTGPLNGQCKKNKNKRWYITQEHIFTYRKE